MKIERRSVGTVEVCTPMDALVEDGSRKFSESITECLHGSNPRVVVDMGEVGYMDSVALEGLLSIAEGLAHRGAQLKMASMTPTCREILELTGLSEQFQFFEDVNAAVRSFL